VLVATTQSKSILRAVAGQAAAAPWIDYFPSYEMIVTPPFRGMFFAENGRTVTADGVEFVMDSFFAGQAATFGAPEAPAAVPKPNLLRRLAVRSGVPWQSEKRREAAATGQDVVCEEQLLDAFGSPNEDDLRHR
jgi:hypothetical protein